MSKEQLVVNGYKVPGGYSGAAVRRACELIIENPGITQKEVLDAAVGFSGLNYSTAGWITSPGPKSPATILWDRRKEGVFRCYPNEHTEKVLGAQEAFNEEFIRCAVKKYKSMKYHPTVGDLIEVIKFSEGVFIGYSFYGLHEDGSIGLFEEDGIWTTFEETLRSRKSIKLWDEIRIVIMKNGSNKLENFRMLNDIRPANM